MSSSWLSATWLMTLRPRSRASARDGLVEPARDGVGRVRREADVEARRRGGLRRGEPPLDVGHRLVEARVVDAEDLEVDAAAQAGLGRPPRASPRRSSCRRWW